MLHFLWWLKLNRMMDSNGIFMIWHAVFHCSSNYIFRNTVEYRVWRPHCIVRCSQNEQWRGWGENVETEMNYDIKTNIKVIFILKNRIIKNNISFPRLRMWLLMVELSDHYTDGGGNDPILSRVESRTLCIISED